MVSPTTVALGIGDKVQITATIRAPVSTSFIWTSSDTTIASVVQTDAFGNVANVTSRKFGVASIKATAFVDPTQSASAIIVVGNGAPSGLPGVSINAIDEVAGGVSVPANLASANGVLDIAFSANWLPTDRVDSAELVVHRATSDTVVATAAVPATLPSAGKWTDTLVWNTGARSANGSSVFANGNYTLSVKALFKGQTSESTRLTVTLSNP